MDSLVAAVALAVLHAKASALRFLDLEPRSRWLSAAGGVALAYVFVHLLPELARIQERVTASGFLGGIERHTYIVALAGIATFYVLEQLARRPAARTERDIGWMHLASYAVYNAIIGYALVQRAEDDGSLLWTFAVAMGVHFVVNDHSLRQHHGALYNRAGRWVVSAAILSGWAVGRLVDLHESAVGLVLAFIAGGVILNVLKEELPEERRSRLMPFVAGAGAYTTVLLGLGVTS